MNIGSILSVHPSRIKVGKRATALGGVPLNRGRSGPGAVVVFLVGYQGFYTLQGGLKLLHRMEIFPLTYFLEQEGISSQVKRSAY